MDPRLENVILNLPGYFVPERSKGINLTAQLTIADAAPGRWLLEIRDMRCRVQQTKADNPQLELTAQSADLLDVLSGRISASRAYMQGKLQLKGSMLQALKLAEMFDIPDEIMANIKI